MPRKGSVRYRRESRNLWKLRGVWCEWKFLEGGDVEIRPRGRSSKKYIVRKLLRSPLDLFSVGER